MVKNTPLCCLASVSALGARSNPVSKVRAAATASKCASNFLKNTLQRKLELQFDIYFDWIRFFRINVQWKLSEIGELQLFL